MYKVLKLDNCIFRAVKRGVSSLQCQLLFDCGSLAYKKQKDLLSLFCPKSRYNECVLYYADQQRAPHDIDEKCDFREFLAEKGYTLREKRPLPMGAMQLVSDWKSWSEAVRDNVVVLLKEEVIDRLFDCSILNPDVELKDLFQYVPYKDGCVYTCILFDNATDKGAVKSVFVMWHITETYSSVVVTMNDGFIIYSAYISPEFQDEHTWEMCKKDNATGESERMRWRDYVYNFFVMLPSFDPFLVEKNHNQFLYFESRSKDRVINSSNLILKYYE